MTTPREEARFKILRLVESCPEITQRQLSKKVGISLGAVNYCMRALIERGLVKVGNFSRSSNKPGYVYVLTPAGLKEKTSLARVFLTYKVQEYEALKLEIESLAKENRAALDADYSSEQI